jgi:hypothetical protein
MPQSIFVVHYKVLLQGNSIDGYTTINCDPPNSVIEAGLAVTRSIQATAPNATVEIVAIKEISQQNYDTLLGIIRAY